MIHPNLPQTNTIWLLFDIDNGDPSSKHYVWWFSSRDQAREYKKSHLNSDNPFKTELVGPVKAHVQSIPEGALRGTGCIMSLDEKIDKYFELQKEIHQGMGYQEDWKVIPMEDRRDEYWFVTGDDDRYCYSPEPFTRETIEAGQVIYGGLIYTQRFLPKYVYRGENHTMVSCDTQTDGNKILMIFSNDKECTDQELINLYNECW